MKCRWEAVIEISCYELTRMFDNLQDAGKFIAFAAELVEKDDRTKINVRIVPVFEEGEF